MEDLTLVAVVIVALFFDFTNGFHDTANAIATSVSTRALTPRTAVLIAAILNFAGAFVSLKVAATVATGIVDPEAVTLSVVLAGLVGAITWNLVTWFLGLPSSSSHALIGGIGGRSDRGDRVGRHRVAGRVGQGRHTRAALSRARLSHRADPDARDRVGDPEAFAQSRESRLPARADRLRQLRRVHARDERRPEDDGDHRARAHRLRPYERGGVRNPVLGRRERCHRDGTRHVRGWLADHQDDGHPHRQDRPAAGIRSSVRMRRNPLDDRALRISRLHDPDDHGMRDGSGRKPEVFRGALGDRRKHRRWPGSSPSRPRVSSARRWRSSRACPPGTSSSSFSPRQSPQRRSSAAATRRGGSFQRTLVADRLPPPIHPMLTPRGAPADTQCRDGDASPHRARGEPAQSRALPSGVPRPSARARRRRDPAAAGACEVLRDLLLQPRRVLPGAGCRPPRPGGVRDHYALG